MLKWENAVFFYCAIWDFICCDNPYKIHNYHTDDDFMLLSRWDAFRWDSVCNIQ